MVSTPCRAAAPASIRRHRRRADAAPPTKRATRQLLDAIAASATCRSSSTTATSKARRKPAATRIRAPPATARRSRKPLFLLPGQHDWADCGRRKQVATTRSSGSTCCDKLFCRRYTRSGQTPFPLTRESEVARFRPFRENVRWQADGIVFVGLNAPSPNNHYLSAGGRNGEFEDRVIANTFWLEHAAEFAKRRGTRARSS